MTTPIRPSLAQMLNPQAAPPAAARPTQSAGGFAGAMAAQKAFFQSVTAPKITPATYTASEIERATAPMQAATSAAQDTTQPLKRPGSYLNIVI